MLADHTLILHNLYLLGYLRTQTNLPSTAKTHPLHDPLVSISMYALRHAQKTLIAFQPVS